MNAEPLPWPPCAIEAWHAGWRAPGEATWEASCERLALAAVHSEREPGRWLATLREQLERRAFLPAATVPIDGLIGPPVGFINLAAFVLDRYEPGARIDGDGLARATRTGIRYIANAYDQERLVDPPRASLGVVALADALAMLGHRYDSWTGRGAAEDLQRQIAIAAYDAACDLAAERGARTDGTVDPVVTRLPPALVSRIRREGLRHERLLTLGHDGLVAALAGGAASGSLPLSRHVDGLAMTVWRDRFDAEPLPYALAEGRDPHPDACQAMAAALRPWISGEVAVAASPSGRTGGLG